MKIVLSDESTQQEIIINSRLSNDELFKLFPTQLIEEMLAQGIEITIGGN